MIKRRLVTLGLCGLTLFLVLDMANAGQKRGRGARRRSETVITAEEARDLLFMREEEKLARDVYITLYNEYGLRVFNNISESEQKHMDAILGLIEKYGLEDPALGFGLFTDPVLQDLYDELVMTGLQSKVDALLVGALIEEVDLEDIERAMERTKQSAIRSVYKNLLSGSKRHLNAFVKNYEVASGEEYVAQEIPQQAVDAILRR